MKLGHNVTHATFTQSVIVIFLATLNGFHSGITSCIGTNKNDCAANSVVAVIMVILVILWFGFLSALVYATWIRRTNGLIALFIVLELFTVGVSAFDLKHHGDLLSTITSAIDLVVGLWVLFMSYYLIKLRGKKLPPKTGRSRSKLYK